VSRYGWGTDYYQGEQDFERRGRRDYDRDRYPSYGSPDWDYQEGFKHAEREAEEKADEERRQREAEERREEEARAERRRQEYWEMERLRDEEQYQEEFPEEEDAA
jgi:colicin import membrane protein